MASDEKGLTGAHAMTDDERRKWVDAIISVCEVQQMGGESVYPHLESLFVHNKPLLDDYPLSRWIVQNLPDELVEKHARRMNELAQGIMEERRRLATFWTGRRGN